MRFSTSLAVLAAAVLPAAFAEMVVRPSLIQPLSWPSRSVVVDYRPQQQPRVLGWQGLHD